MATAYLFVEVHRANMFGKTGDVAVMIIFIGLTLIFFVGIPIRLAGWNRGGIWLIYCAWLRGLDLSRSLRELAPRARRREQPARSLGEEFFHSKDSLSRSPYSKLPPASCKRE